MRKRIAILVAASVTLVESATSCSSPDHSTPRYLDWGAGEDWPGYGRTFGQQHYSPLSAINEQTVARLGLAWFLDLGPENSATQPIAVDGVLYYATGLSVLNAVDAATGKPLWRYDPKVAEAAGLNLRLGWGVRGISWWNGKLYTGTTDGRLIAVDAKTGKEVWSVRTFDKSYPAHINGAPRVFDGKVIIGYASTTGATRGYVTTYHAETGRRLWRFHTVPGNPAEGLESEAMKKAAATWVGQWWQYGGGADVWNAIAYDPNTDTVFIGTGSGYPWNRRVRSADQGDNLFVASIVALTGKSGEYRWHYQTSPGDTWDHDATMDIELADLVIDGHPRKVLLQAPKNGFFYVIDRLTGELISAEPYEKVTWASRVDLKSGRPMEAIGARYPKGSVVEIWPSGVGAHSWMPMAFSSRTQLVYIPTIHSGDWYTDQGVNLAQWCPPVNRTVEGALGVATGESTGPANAPKYEKAPRTGALVAWNPVTQKPVWRIPQPTMFNGGLLATAGDLVFQGTIDGTLKAYAALTGEVRWFFPAQAPLLGTPISYAVNGEQYVTVLSGLGMGVAAGAGSHGNAERYRLDPRSQHRRVLTFKLDGKEALPVVTGSELPQFADLEFQPDEKLAIEGRAIYGRHCATCHGAGAIASTHAPDLRRSGIVLSSEAFDSVVHDGALVPRGMPAFGELTAVKLEALRQYIRTEANRFRKKRH